MDRPNEAAPTACTNAEGPIATAAEKVVDLAKAEASGPGIEDNYLITKEETSFTVDTRNCGPVGPTVAKCYDKEGKSIPMKMMKNSDGVEEFFYTPPADGDYFVHVLVDNQEIPNSPFKVQVDTLYDCTEDIPPNYVMAYGLGLQYLKKDSAVPSKFYIDCRNIDGPSSLTPEVLIYDSEMQLIPNEVKPTSTPRLYEASFNPLEHSQSNCFGPRIVYDSHEIPGSPCYVAYEDKEKEPDTPGLIEGLKKTTKVRTLQTFQVSLKEGVKSEPKVEITDKHGAPAVPVKLTKLNPTTYQAEYTPSELGPLVVTATADGKIIEGTPVSVSVVEHPIDIDKIKVEGLAPVVEVGKLRSFKVLSPETHITPDLVDVKVLSPSLKPVKLKKESILEGTEVSFVPEETGPHVIGCFVQDQPVHETPCNVKSVQRNKMALTLVKKQIQTQLSLTDKEGKVGQLYSFTVICRDGINDTDEIEVAVFSPDEHKLVPVKWSRIDEDLLCEFVPVKAGPHYLVAAINIFPVKGCPATIIVQDIRQ